MGSTTQTIKPETTQLNNLIIQAIQSNKGKDICLLDLRGLDGASTDYMIVCHGSSSTQMNGIITNIEKSVRKEMEMDPFHVEGKNANNWYLIDYFDVIVHVFSAEKRPFYNIESLWGDAKVISFSS